MGRFENYFFDDEILVYLTYFCIVALLFLVIEVLYFLLHRNNANNCVVFRGDWHR